jgi:DNA (cytosine-5)-methyltransferase 1
MVNSSSLLREMYTPTVKSYFSGAGGLDCGLVQAGVKVIQSYEMEKNCCNTLRANFNHEVIEGDITQSLVIPQPDSDIMAFTYPCTKYSAIADIHGTRTGDELYLHAFRHFALKQPEAYVLENVPGMLKFKIVMEAMTKLPGYYINVFCPVNASSWLPQERKRLIIFGTKKPFMVMNPGEGERIKLKDILEENPEISIPDSVYSRLKGKYRDLPIISDPEKDLAPTAVAHYAKDRGTRLVKDERYPFNARPYSVREYARLQGFPDDFNFSGSECDAYRQIGNAVAVPMGKWIGENLIRYFNN